MAQPMFNQEHYRSIQGLIGEIGPITTAFIGKRSFNFTLLSPHPNTGETGLLLLLLLVCSEARTEDDLHIYLALLFAWGRF